MRACQLTVATEYEFINSSDYHGIGALQAAAPAPGHR